MNRLEEYIRENKSLFDEEPATGHFERLQCRDVARHVSTRRTLLWGISIAASIAILFTISVVWKQNQTMACEDAANMKICYLEKMNVIAGQIEMLIMDFDQWDQDQVMNDVQNIFDAVNSDFESELPEELPDDMAKVILADYYRRNMQGLKMIVETISNEQ